jgi:hypothetical protein
MVLDMIIVFVIVITLIDLIASLIAHQIGLNLVLDKLTVAVYILGTHITIATQHFDKGNENIEMDITEYVNSVLTGNTNVF